LRQAAGGLAAQAKPLALGQVGLRAAANSLRLRPPARQLGSTSPPAAPAHQSARLTPAAAVRPSGARASFLPVAPATNWTRAASAPDARARAAAQPPAQRTPADCDCSRRRRRKRAGRLNQQANQLNK